MVRAMVRDSGEVIAACVRSRGAYGAVDTRVGLPVRLHRRGLKEIVPLALRPAEQQALQDAAARSPRGSPSSRSLLISAPHSCGRKETA